MTVTDEVDGAGYEEEQCYPNDNTESDEGFCISWIMTNNQKVFSIHRRHEMRKTLN